MDSSFQTLHHYYNHYTNCYSRIRNGSGPETAKMHFRQALVTSDVLTHFNPALQIQLTCDASLYGVGAVISYVLPCGE